VGRCDGDTSRSQRIAWEKSNVKDNKMTETLSEQSDKYRANWRTRVPADRQALMDQHVAHLTATGIERSAKQLGDRADPLEVFKILERRIAAE
jgi:hypothetical protein